MTMNVRTSQRQFLDDELFQLTLAAVVQRGSVYKPKLSEKAHQSLYRPLQDALRDLSVAYVQPVPEEAHIKNIVALSDRLSGLCGDVLAGNRFRIGSAQKALNLWLKYQWCLDLCPEPPHCPFDAMVLARIPKWKGPKWTALDSVDDYRRLVAEARACACAKDKSLAVWELYLYNEVASSGVVVGG